MISSHIDTSVIAVMTDEQLKRYIPAYGDRLTTVAFCKKSGKTPNDMKAKSGVTVPRHRRGFEISWQSGRGKVQRVLKKMVHHEQMEARSG